MIFVGLLFEKKEEKTLISNSRDGSVQNQVNNFQWNLINGFEANGISDLMIINALPVGCFPFNYKKIVLKNRLWGSGYVEIGSINIPIFKQIVRSIKIKKLLRKHEDKNIIIYSTYLPFLRAVYKIKDKNVILVVPDLPEFYDLGSTSFFKKWLRKINNHLIYKYIKRIDKFVLLTDKMKYPLSVGNKPYVVVEGVFNPEDFPSKYNPVINQEKKVILYSGTLNVAYGIRRLVDSFLTLDNRDIELHIYGIGECADYISKCATIDKRIVYHGFQPRETVLDAYQHASILVNPRANDADYVKYSFPSKMMEYLASGIPVLAYKLDGVPEEYDRYINYIEDDFAESFKTIFDNYNFYLLKAKAARDFVYTKKNVYEQTKKIKELLV